jgi:hypothetical protein
MEEQTQIQEETPVVEQNESITFISDEEVAQATSRPQEEQPTQEVAPEVEQQQETFVEPEVAQPEAQPEYAPEQIEGAVFEFLSERLGRNIASFDDLQAQQQEQRELDERISVIFCDCGFCRKDRPRTTGLVYLSAVKPFRNG